MVYSVPTKRQMRKKNQSDMTRIANALERIADALEEKNKPLIKEVKGSEIEKALKVHLDTKRRLG